MTDLLTSIRLPTAFIDRADRLLERMADAPEMAAHGALNRSDVLRLAILEGLTALEDRYPARRKKRAK